MAEPLKNLFFQEKFIRNLAERIKGEYHDFNPEVFLKRIYDDQWENEELKQRMAHISVALEKELPRNYPEALQVLMEIGPEYKGFDAMVFPDFVGQFGLGHLDLSLEALELFTSQCSSEFAIRPFILEHEKETLTRIKAWSKSPNEHLRRLASEGCRPRLPWAMALPKFKQDPHPILPILDNLKSDPSEYVRKSVANNLNDITKDNPGIALNVIERWKVDASTETKWIIKHALRSLVKSGDQRALKILGYGPAPINLTHFSITPKKVKLGGHLSLSFELKNPTSKPLRLVIDYIIHFTKASGKSAPKVFKLTSIELAGGATRKFTKNHSIKPISTRKYYPGRHQVEIQINGAILGKQFFDLEM